MVHQGVAVSCSEMEQDPVCTTERGLTPFYPNGISGAKGAPMVTCDFPVNEARKCDEYETSNVDTNRIKPQCF